MSEPSRDPRSDAELLADLRASAEEEWRFYSRGGKPERERWVVSEFLRCRGIDLVDAELLTEDQHSKIDLRFRDARFQVKEITNPGTKRGDEARAVVERLRAAKTLEDVIAPPFSYDVPPPVTIYSLVSEKAACLSVEPKYKTVKATLDLLFYVTRTHTSLIRRVEIDTAHLASLGWRSISCLAGGQAVVLFADATAPGFIHRSL